MLNIQFVSVAMLGFVSLVTGCGGSGSASTAHGTGTPSGSLSGPLAFPISHTSASSQLSGGGQNGADNLTVFMHAGSDSDPCTPTDTELSISVYSRDGSPLSPGAFPIHQYAGAENAFASLEYIGSALSSAISGTATFTALDPGRLLARGSFEAQFKDGSTLSGTFDTEGTCTAR